MPLRFTPTYAPPEAVQAALRGEPCLTCHPSIDVWGLGQLAWELLTRHKVFDGGDRDKVSQGGWVDALARGSRG